MSAFHVSLTSKITFITGVTEILFPVMDLIADKMTDFLKGQANLRKI